MNVRGHRRVGTSDPIDARRALTGTQIATVAAYRTRTEDLAVPTARAEVTRLAEGVVPLDQKFKARSKQITGLVNRSLAGGPLEQPGLGPVPQLSRWRCGPTTRRWPSSSRSRRKRTSPPPSSKRWCWPGAPS